MDVRALVGARPTGQRAQQIVSGIVSLEQPAPQSFDDPLYVVISGHSSELSYPFTWPKIHGDTLPVRGAAVRLGYDEQGVPFVLGWDGAETPTPSLQLLTGQQEGLVLGTAAVSWAGTSADGNVTVTHGLGRTPAWVSVPDFVIPGSRSWQCFAGTYTSTTFALLARPDGVFTGTVNFPWAAIG